MSLLVYRLSPILYSGSALILGHALDIMETCFLIPLNKWDGSKTTNSDA